MKILPIKGRWIPSNNIVAGVLIADHRYGAESSVSVSNDAYQDASMYWGEMLFFKYNLKATTFINSDVSFWKSQVIDFENTGKIYHDLYLMTDKWVNPITGIYEIIPDYYSATWTSAGASVFENAIAGQPKPTGVDGSGATILGSRYPNHGQQMYDISNGNFGVNQSTNTIGSSNLSEFNLMLSQIRTPMESALNRKVISASYRNGITNCWFVCKDKMLGIRNSSGRLSGPALTSYGFKQPEKTMKLGEFFYTDGQIATNPNLGWTYNHHLVRQNTIQYESLLTAGGAGSDNYVTANILSQDYITTLIDGNGSNIKNLFTSGGWYQEFTHWANMKNGTGWTGTKGDIRALYEDYLAHLSSLLDGHFVFKGGYGEIVGYHTLRDSVVRVDLYGITNGIRINLIKNNHELNTLMTEPITIILDLSDNVEFSNKEFKPSLGCKGIRKISNNIFAIDLVNSCDILIDSVGVYYDFTNPTGTATINGNTITINSNIKTKAVVYSVDANGIVSQIARDNELKTSRTLNITASSNIKVGLVSELGESTLIEL